MNIRNSEYKNIERTIVDVEIEHPKYGWIPYTFNSGNPDTSFDFEIREWLKTATIKEYVEPIIPAPTEEELKSLFIASIQNLLDSKAQEKNYDNILSACSYAGYDNPFRAEGEAYGTWRASCWQIGYQILSEVEAGTRPMPTIEEALADMPELVLP